MASNKRIKDEKGECVFNKAWLDEPEFREWVGAAVENSGQNQLRVLQGDRTLGNMGVVTLRLVLH